MVTGAGVLDRDGGRLLLRQLKPRLERLSLLWVDGAYNGSFAEEARDLGLRCECAPTPKGAGFQVQPRRWVVERTFGWLNRFRRLSKDYDLLPSHGEAWVLVAMIRIGLRRLAKTNL
jgi:putative transposase